MAVKQVLRYLKPRAPVILDVAGFLCVVVGAVFLFGAWAWLVAGGALILFGLRASD
jgi:hypothetical protein